ncbi:MAG TPA: POTRA domain-containing protein [Flavitalea sp.]|nr:POTRA domain-containing protein [Flavitalea sp.]
MSIRGYKYVCGVLFLAILCLNSFARQSGSETTSSFRDTTVQPELLPPPDVSVSSSPFIIGEIVIQGNKRTKPYIISRELPYKEGDSVILSELLKGFEVARIQLMNTALFNDVVVAVKSFRGYFVDILITVKERWYIFPIPYLKPVDRNISEWAKQGYGMDRLNYGFKFTYYNFTGRNDKLRMWLITGYTRQIQFQYDQPYADQTLKHGYRIGFSYSTNREVNYTTEGNQQTFIDSLSNIRRWHASLEYTYRPGLRTFHGLRLGFTQQVVDSTVVILNPKYFGSGKSRLTYPEIEYTIRYINVDYLPFPLTGWMGELSLMRRGLQKDMDMWQLAGKVTKGWKIASKTYFTWQGHVIVRAPFEQPYINQRMFGYGDLYLRGLEKYVVDGVAAFMTRNTFRRELFRFSIPTYLRSATHDRIPFTIYARTFADIGYSHNPYYTSNSLTNRMLYTGGLGIDVKTFYDFILRFDYSFNQLGQKGLFLHVKNDF